MADPTAPFETWLLHRVAEAVEGAEVSADLLTDLHAAITEVRARPPEARDTLALMELAERVNLPVGPHHGTPGDVAGATDRGAGTVPAPIR
jgi:acetyl-CoA carboxylase alpha subunit